MGFIRAFTGSLQSTFADQWQDFYMPRQDVSATAAVFSAVSKSQNAGRGENTKGSENIITNGTKIIVPDEMALITIQDGAITGIIAEPGGFIFNSEDPNSQSIFAGNGIVAPFITQTWERIKFGGQPASQQLAFYINLKEIPNNKFGTNGEIYWDDAYMQTQVGAITRGTYTLEIIDPLLFVKNFVPLKYLQPGAPVFDFADMDNDAGTQLFNEVVSTLGAAFSNYTNDPSKGNRIARIQGDQVGFAQAMAQAVEDAYQWKATRGLQIVKTAILSMEYDEHTKELMKQVKEVDALSGARGMAFERQSMARGIENAGQNGGGTGLAFMGMGMNAMNGMMAGMQQPGLGQAGYGMPGMQPGYMQPGYVQPGMQQQGYGMPGMQQQAPQQQVQPQTVQQESQQQAQPQVTQQEEDLTQKLLDMKKLLDAGAITQEEYDQVKAKILGL